MSESDKKLVIDFVNIWISTHPDEMRDFFIERDLEIKGMLDPVYGESQDKSMRKIGNLPTDLHVKLKKNFPELYDRNGDGIRWLFKTFKQFLYIDKI